MYIQKITVTETLSTLKLLLFAVVGMAIFITSSVQADEYQQCLVRLQQKAISQGVSEQVSKANLSQVEYDSKVIEYDRRQPEFSESFFNYLNKRVNQWRIVRGRQSLKKHGKLLHSLQQEYGIPAHYLLAFWGLETNFGNYKGKMSIIRSLVTLACDTRRSEFFAAELMLALKLMEREQIVPETMLGSWAGAIGHTQFMPSTYMKYAVDGDGDNKINLWSSIPDALTSAANFLQHLGWKKGFRWGREVTLPDNFGYQNSGIDNTRSLANWLEIGVRKTNGLAIDVADIEAALLVPSGHTGPAFLVYENFSVIMRWNPSAYYAIAVGHLADRIAGSNKLHRPPTESPNLTIAQIQSLQEKLNTLGFNVGKADGIFGQATRKGIRNFQYASKMVADGFPDASLFSALGVNFN